MHDQEGQNIDIILDYTAVQILLIDEHKLPFQEGFFFFFNPGTFSVNKWISAGHPFHDLHSLKLAELQENYSLDMSI